MLRKVLIVGMGNMGQRYQAGLSHLGVGSIGIDVGHDPPDNFDGIIIATPTALHAHHVLHYGKFDVPIMVEKPLACDVDVVNAVCDTADAHLIRVRQVNQYAYLDDPSARGATHYNYYRTGDDGLLWDCISVIAVARTEVTVASDSPIWTCRLNGRKIGLGQMDEAYLMMLDDFVKRPPQRPETDYIRMAHAKVAKMVERAA